jgi:proline iminopeptidase
MVTTTRIPVHGAELNCAIRGQGPACLVLSSIGTRPYQRQIPAELDDHLTQIFVDLRGSGESTGDPASLTFDVLAADLEAVRLALGHPRVAVLGHSILGVLALEVGRRRPDMVSHVIAVGAPPTGDMAAITARATAFFQEDASPERKEILRENMARLPPGTPPAQAMLAQTPLRFSDPRFDAGPLYEGAIVQPAMLAHLMGTLTPGWQIATGAAASTVPTLLAHGRHDYVVPWVLWQPLLAQLPPTTTWHLFERSGHQPFVEEPEAFVATVTAWLAAPSA